MDSDFWELAKAGGAAGVGIGTGTGVFMGILLFIRWMLNFIAGRTDVGHEHLMQILNEVQEEVQQCRAREEESRKREAELINRIAALEGVGSGLGEIRQVEQRIRALESMLKERGE